jgi:hypothetical protein
MNHFDHTLSDLLRVSVVGFGFALVVALLQCDLYD